MAESAAPAIEVVQLSAGYGKSTILQGVDLAVAPGEFVAILGSSGCGKTTLLRTIAGFQKAMSGSIRSFDRDMAHLPPEKRDVAMVFQSYALWPHMTVLGNIGYGLRLRGRSRDEIARRVFDMLALLNLPGLEDRNVTALSGGQRQRVALGRALAIEPRLLLLDEPLSNLDAKVRLQLRTEIKTLQSKLGFAALHVTHDREEAMTMADRIVVMDRGRILQVGTPEEIYHRPRSPFIASFMGAENAITLTIDRGANGLEVAANLDHAAVALTSSMPSGTVMAYFREDSARLEDPAHRAAEEVTLQGTITLRSYPGGHYRYAVAVGKREFMVKDSRFLDVGTKVGLCVPISAMHIFPNDAAMQNAN
jgi:ABC-type Fe3+/spermidine/putrescine transport system ATPase subunit